MRNQKQSVWGSKKGKAVHISEVVSGLECGCFCPSCAGQLVARKGEQRQHHFAHAQKVSCLALGESALHLACKNVIEEEREMVLPEVVASDGLYCGSRCYEPQGNDIVYQSKRVQFDKVELERDLGRIRPDITATAKGSALYIEIKVTHAVDREKALHYEREDKSAIEIDVSDLPRDASRDEIKQRVVDSKENKSWLFNALAAGRLTTCKRKDTAYRFVGCPLPKQALLDNLPDNGLKSAARQRAVRGQAHVLTDCLYCKHALCFTDEHLYCDATPERTKGYIKFPGGF
ncbi:hypothetical protein AL073_06285 [Loktanella sp. 1ANDIMAR09]|nr:hypothetical protein AL073_06285 [Loktanella sp. 1ANDIMAR09]